MEKLGQKLRWNQWPEYGKTGFLVLLIIGVTLGGYGIFTVAMGTSSPLVVVTSDSMSPTLERGHLLVLQKQAPEDIHVGDIIVYNADWHTQAPVVHRVIQRDYVDGEYRYYTQGDNNHQPDPFYRIYDDIVGVVVFSIPIVGNITLFLQQPGVLPVVIVLLIILIMIPEFLPKKDRKERVTDGTTIPTTDALNA
ncbi:MAG: signal peptidase I [Candidatus Thorarchaeota archaeon]